MNQHIGPVILDLMGLELNPEERELLEHPLTGGVILFSRNFEHPEQVTHLCSQIHEVSSDLLITVDQEGGRVQRFKNGFTQIPPMGDLGKQFENAPEQAIQQAEQAGKIIAAELKQIGVDLTFAPVLDLNKEMNTVVGDRAFHRDPRVVITLAQAVMRGLHHMGMAAVGKHFPGHGSVTVDSHLEMPIDTREFSAIAQDDLIPFQHMIHAGIEAVMPAHILFPAVDNKPVGFSARWLKDILRQQLQFTGIIFSDDLNMQGAAFAGNYSERANAALDAGCDMVLICNNRGGAIQILDQLPQQRCVDPEKFAKIKRRK